MDYRTALGNGAKIADGSAELAKLAKLAKS